MGRFSYEKRIPTIGGRGGKKGKRATPKTQFRNTCNGCGGETPCRDSGCRKASGQASYDARHAPRTPKVKKSKLSRGAASKIRKDAKNAYRNAHPSASDSQINRVGRAAVKAAKKRLK